ncbi:PREDICTED: homeobox-leucine zipper protein ATHB-4-like isoform X1 [Camelina sativa]|uniref:Homeobox-leucine zipper protein ATHB-4-like isoform X1 n=1 Tax=Camelina sativa TaxID=90675 RepID=A0ABM0YZA8_CAMSA|nr:PREDICTED: homeobox-leucine zipper protein ATHB-4-like isoform X1 [Camelina sativa]
MGERDDGLGLSLSLGNSQLKEPSLRLNLMPFTTSTSSSFPHMHNQINNSHPQKIHHNSWTHLFQSSGIKRTAAERNSDAGSFLRGFDVNRAASSVVAVVNLEEEAAVVSSPNSTVSSLSGNKRDLAAARGGGEEHEAERASCSHGGGSDDEDCGNGDGSRKKLRLSKEQALVLEETFKEHSTLNPKQKLALAKQLNLRARQVEVWFQNRRARTKLKQTEVDCEYLKRCCDNLTEENRRLQKEVSELRALKLSPHLYMHMTPPTTLTMCPSCERVSSSSSANVTAAPPPPPPATVVGRPSPQRSTPWTAISLQQVQRSGR